MTVKKLPDKLKLPWDLKSGSIKLLFNLEFPDFKMYNHGVLQLDNNYRFFSNFI